MKNHLLDYYGKINAHYLHAYSEAGSEFLLQELNVKNNECILEIGFGTGGTLVKIKARSPSVRLFGLDASEIMIKKSLSRLRFCGLSNNITLQKINTDNIFPFYENMFDKIYVESVLGIQEGEQLQLLLSEIHRTLKPNGKLILNETVWLPEITLAEMKSINALCKTAFGIIQANAEYPISKHWLQLFKQSGFSKIELKKIDVSIKSKALNTSELLSKLFSFSGKLKKINPAMIKQMNVYKKAMDNLYKKKQHLEGVLFIASK